MKEVRQKCFGPDGEHQRKHEESELKDTQQRVDLQKRNVLQGAGHPDTCYNFVPPTPLRMIVRSARHRGFVRHYTGEGMMTDGAHQACDGGAHKHEAVEAHALVSAGTGRAAARVSVRVGQVDHAPRRVETCRLVVQVAEICKNGEKISSCNFVGKLFSQLVRL